MEALRLCRALASTQADAPSLLLLQGPPGVGKTHLLRATLCCVQARSPRARTMQLSASDLVERLIGAIQDRRPADPLRELAHGDVVAVDDLHVLAGKPMTQREVSLVFARVVESGAKVVCAASCPVQDLAVLTAAIQSVPNARLVEVRPPGERELRRLVVRMARAEEIPIRAATLNSIAAGCAGDVRRAVGALTRCHARASLQPLPAMPQGC